MYVKLPFKKRLCLQYAQFSKNFLILLFAVSLFNIIYNFYIPIHPDEAYYWYWSQRLELGYFDHPPMIAYLIRLATLFSDHVLFIRLVAVLSVVISSIFIYLLTKKISDEKTALIASTIYLSLPVIQASYSIATPDSPLLIFWSGAVYFAYLALFEKKVKFIYLTGLFLGLALVSKLTAILLIGMIGLFILLKKRELLFSLHTWAAFALTFLLFGGVLYWNSQHEWISFTFQYTHGSSKDFAVSMKYLQEYLLGLVFLITPLFFILSCYILAKKGASGYSDAEKYLLFITFFIVLFFGYKALYKKMELNWYAPLLITLIPFISVYIRRYNLKKLFVSSLVLSVILSVVIKFPDSLLPKNANPKNHFAGYEEAAEKFKEYIKEKDGVLCSDYYSTTSILNYFLPEYKGTVSSILSTRPNMYTIWEKEKDAKLKSCLAFIERDEIKSSIKERCEKIENIEKFVYKSASTSDKTFFFFECGLKPQK